MAKGMRGIRCERIGPSEGTERERSLLCNVRSASLFDSFSFFFLSARDEGLLSSEHIKLGI
jgi:hypothetical protein